MAILPDTYLIRELKSRQHSLSKIAPRGTLSPRPGEAEGRDTMTSFIARAAAT